MANEAPSRVADFYRDIGCKVYPVSWTRSPVDAGNIAAIRELKKIIHNGNYDIVHCHTPIAAVCTRLVCRPLRKDGMKVIYTAHGFHFYNGAPLKNWLLFYPVEKLCAHWTDVLVTINKEDHERAKRKLKVESILYVPGMGVDVKRFSDTVVDRTMKRKELGIPEDAFLLLSVGELNTNKNHRIVIRALGELKDPNIHYMIAGQGTLRDALPELARECGVEKQVHILGQREDIAELNKTADVNVFPSLREGFGLAAIEGMAAGLPLICADNRGTREYADSDNSIVCRADDVKAFANAISTLNKDPALCRKLGEHGQETAKRFDTGKVNPLLHELYK